MSVDALIESLSAIHPKGFDLSLGRIESLLDRLGNPQDRIPPVIHIAGTNGKGSTAAFCRAILEAAGHTVHVHTSPHLVNWTERYRIGAPGGGRLVEDAVLERTLARVAQVNDGRPITIFEMLTAAMFLLFSEFPADYCIVEVGLGGRFDATNVIRHPLVSIITTIALDHEAWLGDRVELIAFEKAGIIKPGTPVAVSPQSDAVREVLEEVALKRGAPMAICGQDFGFHEQAGRLVYQDEFGLMDLHLPRLRGAHQLGNAATAIAALRHAGLDLPELAYEQAMDNVRWPGRMEKLRAGPICDLAPATAEIWIDGGHNPSAGEVVAAELAGLEERSPMPLFIVAGMLNTKQPTGFFKAFAGLAERVFTVPVSGSEHGFDPMQLADIARDCGLEAHACLSVSEALRSIRGLLSGDEPVRILICGSLYLVGEVLRDNLTPPS